MASIDEMIRSYVASWNESDPAKRGLTIEKTWSPEGIYRNATAEFEGYDGIARAVTAAHDAFTANGFVFTLAKVDTNHDAIRYRWEMVPAGGGEPDSIETPAPSSVPTGVSSVTISSSISLRRRAEPETGQPGSRICESRSHIHETEPPEIASARSSSPADSLPDDNAPVGLLLSVW